MSVGLFLLGLLVVGLILYHRVLGPIGYVIFIGFVGIAEYTAFSFLFFSLVFALVLAPFVVPPLRRKLMSIHLLRLYQKKLPAMSETEKTAIDAGTVWWDAQLFSGKPNWRQLDQFPKPQLSAEEQAFLEGPAERVCQMINDWQITHEQAAIPKDVWDYLKGNGFFAMIIKKQYGGLEFSPYAQTLVLQKLAAMSTVISSTVGVPNSLGPGELLQEYGLSEQKDYYLTRLARGEDIPCFALTSPEAGSDAGAIPDMGVVCYGSWGGEDNVLGMKITWNKRYITLAPVATVLGLAFRLYDPQHLLGEEENLGITCALIPRNIPGVKVGRRHFPLNQPFQNGPTSGVDVFLPITYIIGGAKMAGQGWRMLMECLSVGRGITLPSTSTGVMKSLALTTGAYSYIRRQFKIPIGQMEGVQEPLARIAGQTYLMDAASRLTVIGLGLGEKPSIISAIVKYHLTDRMQKCVIDAMDIHGGKGICLGPSNYVGRMYQGAPIAITVEGANILTRCMIIYGQGVIRCHPYLLQEMQAASMPSQQQALLDFDRAIWGHIGFASSNLVRSLWFGLSGGYLITPPKRGELARYYQLCTRFSTYLALLSDLCMGIYGGHLKRKERLTARLGDIFSYLYLCSAVFKRFGDDGEPSNDLPLVLWGLQDSLYRIQQAFYDILHNFPRKALPLALKCLFFPLGRVVKKPSDQLDQEVAMLLQKPSDTRTRLGQWQCWQQIKNNPMGLVEKAFHDVLAAEPIFAKIKQHLDKPIAFMQLDDVADVALQRQIINEDEAQILRIAEESRLRTISVDDFESSELASGRQSA